MADADAIPIDIETTYAGAFIGQSLPQIEWYAGISGGPLDVCEIQPEAAGVGLSTKIIGRRQHIVMLNDIIDSHFAAEHAEFIEAALDMMISRFKFIRREKLSGRSDLPTSRLMVDPRIRRRSAEPRCRHAWYFRSRANSARAVSRRDRPDMSLLRLRSRLNSALVGLIMKCVP